MCGWLGWKCLSTWISKISLQLAESFYPEQLTEPADTYILKMNKPGGEVRPSLEVLAVVQYKHVGGEKYPPYKTSLRGK